LGQVCRNPRWSTLLLSNPSTTPRTTATDHASLGCVVRQHTAADVAVTPCAVWPSDLRTTRERWPALGDVAVRSPGLEILPGGVPRRGIGVS
jgi:hypothetical protein